jgi:hypothetical protein
LKMKWDVISVLSLGSLRSIFIEIQTQDECRLVLDKSLIDQSLIYSMLA